jgi:hypothetical protein
VVSKLTITRPKLGLIHFVANHKHHRVQTDSHVCSLETHYLLMKLLLTFSFPTPSSFAEHSLKSRYSTLRPCLDRQWLAEVYSILAEPLACVEPHFLNAFILEPCHGFLQTTKHSRPLAANLSDAIKLFSYMCLHRDLNFCPCVQPTSATF